MRSQAANDCEQQDIGIGFEPQATLEFLLIPTTEENALRRVGWRYRGDLISKIYSCLRPSGIRTPRSTMTFFNRAERRSLLFTGVRVNSFAEIDHAVILPYVEIGRSARLKNVIVDRGVRIPEGLIVGEDPALDAHRFRRTNQDVCLITQLMINRLGT